MAAFMHGNSCVMREKSSSASQLVAENFSKVFRGIPLRFLRFAFTSTKLCTHRARLTYAKGDSNRRLRLLIQSIPIMTATVLETGEAKKNFPTVENSKFIEPLCVEG